MTQAPRRLLVVCVGNPDRGDDGLGPLVAKTLAGALPADVGLACANGDMLGLIPQWSDVGDGGDPEVEAALARALEQAPRHIIVYAVEGAAFASGTAMTPAVATAAGEVARRVVAEVESLR